MERTIELYPTQYDFVTCQDRLTGFIAGIGAGKTFAGVVKALVAHGQTHGLGLVVAPTYPMLRDATLRTFLEVAHDVVVDFHKGEMRAELRGGGEVLFRSADNPDRLRGPNLHWAWIDEAALCPKMTWEIVIGRLRAGGKAGPCWVTTTPRGRNWLYERAQEMKIFRATVWDNPFLAPEFVQSVEQAYTGKFARQELYGEFVSFEGLVYDEFDRSIHVMERSAKEFQRFIMGIDEGYTNPAVILVIGLDSDDRAHVMQEFYQRRVLQDAFVEEAARLAKQYGVEACYVDPSAASLIAALRRAGVPARAAENAVMDGIQRVKARLVVQGDGRPRLTVAPSCVNTISEFEMYVWKEDHDEPVKQNDHAMDALRYALARSMVKARVRWL